MAPLFSCWDESEDDLMTGHNFLKIESELLMPCCHCCTSRSINWRQTWRHSNSIVLHARSPLLLKFTKLSRRCKVVRNSTGDFHGNLGIILKIHLELCEHFAGISEYRHPAFFASMANIWRYCIMCDVPAKNVKERARSGKDTKEASKSAMKRQSAPKSAQEAPKIPKKHQRAIRLRPESAKECQEAPGLGSARECQEAPKIPKKPQRALWSVRECQRSTKDAKEASKSGLRTAIQCAPRSARKRQRISRNARGTLAESAIKR